MAYLNKNKFHHQDHISIHFTMIWNLLAFIWITSNSICYSYPATDDYDDLSGYSLGAPLITPTSADITLEANSDYTLRCESKDPIKWIYPELFENALNVKEEPYPTQDPIRPYGNQLVLYNVTAFNVGYYYCINEGISDNPNFLDEEITQFKASKIYIFVNDLKTLLVPLEHPIVQAFQYSDVIIPCKPTSKDTEVELQCMTNEEHTLYSSDAKYDPKIGFIVKIVHISDGGVYQCRTADGGEYTDIHVIVLPSVTSSINKPVIISHERGHAYEGSSFNLTCQVDVIPQLLYNITWDTPNNNIAMKERRALIHGTRSITSKEGMPMGESVLIIYNANKQKDSGVYKCSVEDNSNNKNSNTFRMVILGQHEHYITLNEASNNTVIRQLAGKTVQMVVYYTGYPIPSLKWYDKDNIPIPLTTPHGKYTVTQNDRDTVLRIRNVTLKDSGIYTVRATNGIDNEELKFNLSVKDKPTVSVENVYIQAGEEAIVECRSDAFPPATISWSFTPCKIQPKWPTCLGREGSALDNKTFRFKEETDNHQVSVLRFKPSEPGIVICTAKNKLGTDQKEGEVLIGDLIRPIVVYGVEDGRQIAVGDEVVLTCGALAYNYSADLYWYQDNILVEPNKDIQIINSHSDFSYKKVLKFKNIQHENTGSYECRVRPIMDDGSDRYESRILQIKVNDPLAPIMDTTNLVDDQIDANLGDKLLLQCKASGIPKPSVTWYKDGNVIKPVTTGINQSNHILEEDGTVLKIQFIKPEDEGMYKCHVSNRLGTIEKSTQLKISDMPGGLRLGWILSIVAIILILIIFIIYLCVRVIKERELLRQMKAAGLANFEEGAVECINPALSLEEQAELLPYDRRFEFPKEKLKLGKQLGAGAFGVVLKGVAEGILPDEKETTVAVKMVKKTADNEVMKALVSELKIMVHLGQHLNVVNLLGAVTKNIAKREVMVIVEFCRYGNIQNFLLKNRKRFINQINPDTDQIDPTITSRDQRWSNDYEYNSSKSDGDGKSTGLKVGPNSTGYIRQSELYVGGNMDSCNTEQTLISSVHEGDESIILSNNSEQPAWRSNYKPDGSTAMDITTTHLISWAFQVARGMDYLASRKVLHGDLAARNILLCDDNVVKICDFGLARSMYNNDNYKKQGETPLPIKWLALESLSDHVFSTYSDVWSFGIVLWEFFSLAKVPYPGMEADHTLYLKLKDGYRMEKPQYSNQELYDIMLECWSTNPEARPLFNELEKKLARLLEDEVTNHYIDLNEPYLRMNSEYFKTAGTDYLALMGCPDEQAPQAPRYVNGNIIPDLKVTNSSTSVNNSGTTAYLHMSPKSGNVIFSPRPQSDDDYVKSDHFQFPEPVSPTISNNLDSPSISKQRTKKTGIPEEIPMLLNNSSALSQYYDSEAELSPDPKMVNKKNPSNISCCNDDVNGQKMNFSNINSSGSPNNKNTTNNETTLSIDDSNYMNLNAANKNLIHNSSSNSNLNLNSNNILGSNRDIVAATKKQQINGGKDAFSNPSYHILTK